ncbi:unnamed protein product [Phytomonas sp. EM1]|nr:unnamed protein product [Phytomonas sp. EM1]|eukprot:CCW62536.1 unnamed protein product [Phytomonas sp. isolate EM1]
MLNPSRKRHPPAQLHCRIAKHCFPVYSHPVFRAEVQERRFVETHVEEALQDTELMECLNQQIEAYFLTLQDPSKMGNSLAEVEISDAAIAKILDEALAIYQGDSTATESGDRGEILRETPFENPLGSVESTGASRERISRMEKSIEAKKWPLRGRHLPPLSVVSPSTRGGAVETRNCRLLPDLTPVVVGAGGGFGEEGPLTTEGSPERAVSKSPSQTGEGRRPRISRRGARAAIYSLLRTRLPPECADRIVGEAEIRRARRGKVGVGASQLRALPPASFAELDVWMDGNSTCLRRRPKAADLTPAQRAAIHAARALTEGPSRCVKWPIEVPLPPRHLSPSSSWMASPSPSRHSTLQSGGFGGLSVDPRERAASPSRGLSISNVSTLKSMEGVLGEPPHENASFTQKTKFRLPRMKGVGFTQNTPSSCSRNREKEETPRGDGRRNGHDQVWEKALQNVKNFCL